MIDSFIPKINTLTWQSFDELVSLRRDLHRYPELSGQEIRTSQILARALAELGFEVRMGKDGHGLWADLITNPARPTVALRVDMDALPITEVNSVAYRSRIPGVMHACGHDVHAAIGIGVGTVLSQMQADLPGNLRLIFQPEEEEITGALRMIRAGVLQDPAPEAIFGVHVAPLPAGQIGWTDDLFLAGFTHYLVTLTPLSGHHTARAHLGAIAQHCCRAIKRLNHWHLPETWEDMNAFWRLMHAGDERLKRFIIYDADTNTEDPGAWPGQFGLGIKAADPHLAKAAIGRVRVVLNRICHRTRTRFRIEPMGAMIDMRNNPELVRSNLPALQTAVGTANLRHMKAAFPFNCEDFAYYTKYIPGAMYWLGGANPDEGKFALLHTPDFDVDETCLATGTIAMAALLVNSLSHFSPKSEL